MQNLSVKIENYKCFKEESGFDVIKRVNILIGRNNSGKSSLLDLIETVASRNYTFDRPTWQGDTPPQVIFQDIISQNAIEKTFPKNVSGGFLNSSHLSYGLRFRGRTIKWSKAGKEQRSIRLIQCDDL